MPTGARVKQAQSRREYTPKNLQTEIKKNRKPFCKRKRRPSWGQDPMFRNKSPKCHTDFYVTGRKPHILFTYTPITGSLTGLKRKAECFQNASDL